MKWALMDCSHLQPVVTIFLREDYAMQIASDVVVLPDATSFPPLAPLGTQLYLLDGAEF